MVRSARAAAGIETGLTFPFEPLRGAIVKLMLTESGSDAEDLKTGGEGGIRTLDTFPYTHFPGVLLQPLGHLTVLRRVTVSQGRGKYKRCGGYV